MSDNVLKSGLENYPGKNWDDGIDLKQFSMTQFVSTISEILETHGHFPVPWGSTGIHEGLSVVGHDGSYIGHWNTFEGDGETGGITISTASEDLGNVNMAADVIFRTYFSGYFKS